MDLPLNLPIPGRWRNFSNKKSDFETPDEVILIFLLTRIDISNYGVCWILTTNRLIINTILHIYIICITFIKLSDKLLVYELLYI